MLKPTVLAFLCEIHSLNHCYIQATHALPFSPRPFRTPSHYILSSNMPPLVLQLLIYLVAWASGVAGLVFINSFDNWVGNTTYRIDWNSSSSDPSFYDLDLVQPRSIYSVDVTPNVSWPDQWSYKYAVQIPRNGDRFIQVSLGSDVWPGVYYWRMSGGNQTNSVSNTFMISSSNGKTNPTTISSLVPVTATQDIVQTSDGHLVTYRSSEVYSSAVIYTTIVVVSDSGKGAPLAKVPMIIGIALGLIFLITLPIILWLVLRCRRRPIQSSGGNKSIPIDLEDVHNSSVLDLMPANAVGYTVASATSTRSTVRQAGAIVDGEKRLVTISQDLPQPTTPAMNSDPFSDPSTPILPKPSRHILITANPSASEHDSPPNSGNPCDPLMSRANSATTSFRAMYSHGAPSIDVHTDPTLNRERLREKIPQQTRQGLYPEHQALSEDDIASRIIVSGRAIDMGSLGRDHVPDVDENGLLPPDYFQATQPIPSRRSSQAFPGTL
ncbi:unnamed protein product [Rhizoctonia solani]|uniref:Uncharacterized protein n=1 Tax=Rhizoctonia solani TaxID=456999 RepID=A0A8H3BHS7_9AGAM|nr:unnamed protein product [Rhizoctonia solani]